MTRAARLSATLCAVTLLVSGCAKEDRSTLRRRAIGIPTESGWARLRLNGDAQRAAGTL